MTATLVERPGPPGPADLDRVFHALADPTRRAVVRRLGVGPASTTELATPFPMALPSFVQHLQVLEAAGIVHSSKTGRVRTFTLDPAPLGPASDWLAEQRDLWTRRLDQLDAFLTRDHPADPTGPITDPTGPITDPSDPITEPTDPITEPTDPITEPTDPTAPIVKES